MEFESFRDHRKKASFKTGAFVFYSIPPRCVTKATFKFSIAVTPDNLLHVTIIKTIFRVG